MSDNLRNWINKLSQKLLSSGSRRSRRQRPVAAKRRPTSKPAFEPLEDRVTPSNFVVTDLSDGAGSASDVTLRYAVNNSTNGTAITFTSGLTGTINLASALTLNHTISITGLGAGSTIINASGSDTFDVGPGAQPSLANLTVQGGSISLPSSLAPSAINLAGGVTVSSNINLGPLGDLSDTGSGNDTVSGTISGSSSSATIQGLVGTYYQTTNGSVQQGQIQPASPTNVNWIGNQVPNVAALLTGPIDFPNISENGLVNGFQDTNGTTYVNFGNNNNDTVARWYGDIVIPGTGTTPVPINFSTSSDDGSMLYIDGIAVVNNNFFQGVTQRTGLVDLTPGLHAIDVEYYNGGGGAAMDAQWDPTGGTNWVDIPNTSFAIPVNGILKSGTGTLTLASSNSYVGPTQVTGGTLEVTANGALGSGAAGVLIASGSSLGLGGGINYTTTVPVSISGSGQGGNGAIENISGSNTFGIPFAFNGSATVGAASGTLTLASAIALGANTLTTVGAGSTSITGNITSQGGTFGGDASGGTTISGSITCSANGLKLTSTQSLTISGNIDLGASGSLTDAGTGHDTVTGVISGEATSTTGTVQGLTGTYFNLGAATNLIQPAATSNAAWLGNQTPAVTALLVGPIDFQDINNTSASTGFTDPSGNSYYDLNTSPGQGNNNNVEARWYGNIMIPGTGTNPVPISFGLGSDDGSMLYIDGNTVVSNNNFQGNGTYPAVQQQATVDLTPGLHTIDVEYYNGGGGASMWAEWDPTGGSSFVDIPNAVFSTTGPVNGVVKTGSGTLTLSNTNTYLGTTTIDAGSLVVTANGAMGPASDPGVTVNSGGTLAFSGGVNYTTAEPVTIVGSGAGGHGAIDNLSGSNSFAGSVTLSGNATVGADAGSLTLGGGVSEGSDTLTTVGAGNITLDFSTNGGTVAADATGTTTIAGDVVCQGSGLTLAGTGVLNVTGNVDLGSTGNLTVSSSSHVTISGVISGEGTNALSNTGSGTLTLTGVNTYTGGTQVNAGVLQDNGTIGDVTVAGGVFGGSGFTGAVTDDAVVDPGLTSASTAILNTGNLSFGTGGAFRAALNGTAAGTSYDQLNVTGSINLTGSVLQASLGYAAQLGDTYTIIHNVNNTPVTGELSVVVNGNTVLLAQNEAFTIDGQLFQISYTGGAGNDVTLTRVSLPSYGDSLDGSGNLVITQEIPTSNDNLTFSLAGGVYTLQDTGGLLFDTPAGAGAGFISGGGTSTITIPASDVTSITVTLGIGNNIFTITGTDAASAPLSVNTGSTAGDQVNITGAMSDSGAVALTSNAITSAVTVTAGSLAVTSSGTSALSGNIATSTGVTLSDTGSVTISGNIDLGSGNLADSSSGQDSISGVISQDVPGDSLSMTGTGTLTLSNSNSYSGTTTVSNGTLIVTANGAMGPATAGGVTVNAGGALAFSGNVSYSNAEAVSISGTGPAGHGAIDNLSGSNSFAGAVTLSGNATINTDAGSLTLSGGVTLATNTLTLAGAGTINVSGNVAGGSVTLNDSGHVNVSGNIDLGLGSLVDTSSGTDTISGAVSGEGANTLTEAGSGSLTLSHTNTYTGATAVSSGKLIVTANGAMGPASDPGVTVSAGAALAFAGNVDYTTLEEPIDIAGAGPAGNGALENLSGNNTFASNITLTGNATIGSDAGTLTLTGNIDLGSAGNLTATGAGNVTATGLISGEATAPSSTTAGLVGDYYNLNPGNYSNGANGSLLVVNTNSAWLGNQTPAATAQLIGPLDFPDIQQDGSAMGFTDTVGNTYYNLNATPGAGANNNIEGRWYGDIVVPNNGIAGNPISFQTSSDDGSVLYIDGNLVVSNNNFQGVTSRSGTVNLTPGVHSIDVAYYQGGGGAAMDAQWDPAGGSNFTDLLPVGYDGTVNSALEVVQVFNSVTKIGSGTLTLSHTNTYIGATTINAGKLVVTANGAAGPATDPGITVNNGGALGFAGGVDYTTAEPLALTGAGPDGNGALVNISGNNTYNTGSTITLSTSVTVGSLSGTLTIDNNIDLGSSANLTVAGAGNTTLNGVISGEAPAQSSVYNPGAAQGTEPGLVGAYYQIGTGANQQVYIQPASAGNSNWIGNQAPTATVLLTGAVDFPNISGNGFQDNGGTTYYNFGNNNNSVEARWYGDIIIPGTGTTPVPVNFATISDDGSMLYVDGNAVVSNNNYQGATRQTGLVNLTPGPHTIDIEYYNGGGGASMDAQWDPTGGTNFVDIPNSAFEIPAVNSLVKVGTGTLTLTNTNTYEGATTINAGTVAPTVDGAMGPVTAAGIMVNTGGALAFSGGVDYATAEPTTISGSGPAGNGAIENVSGNNTFAAPISLSGNATIGSDVAGTTLNLTSPTLSMDASNLTTVGAGNLNIASSLDNGQTSYVGFTGGTGGAVSQQDILNWTFTSGSTNINYGAGFTGTGLQLNGNAAYNGTELQLTDGNGNEASSAWTPTQVPVGSFTSTFEWTYGSNPQADGFTFAIQNNSATALGASGGSLGYGGITGNSTAVEFNLYNGVSTFGVGFDGIINHPIDLTASGINFHTNSSDTFKAVVTNDGEGNLTVSIWDTTTNTSATANFTQTFNLANSYVGFTGGTGGANSTQKILNWTYTSGSTNINYGAGFTGTGMQLNGNAAYNGSALELTNGNNNEASTAWTPTPVSVGNGYATTFEWTYGANPQADGFTFAVQDDNATIVGAGGGSLGYSGIPGNNMAVQFNLYSGVSTFGIGFNGAINHPTDLTASGINFHTNPTDTFKATITNNGLGTLTVSIWDTTLNTSTTPNFTETFSVPATAIPDNSVTKNGTGEVTLSGVSTYIGGTTVTAGTLNVTGSIGNVTLTGGVLGGSGTVGSVADTGATINPGLGATSILNTGSLSLGAGSVYSVTLDGTAAGTSYDQLNATGSINLTGSSLQVSLGYTPVLGDTYTIIHNESNTPITGTFAGMPNGTLQLIDGLEFFISYEGGAGNDVTLIRTNTVPSYAETLDASGNLTITETVASVNSDLNFGLAGGNYTFTDTNGLSFGYPQGAGASFVSGAGTSTITIPSSDVTSITVTLGTGTNIFTFTGTGSATAAPITVNTGTTTGDQLNVTGAVIDGGLLSLTSNSITDASSATLTAGALTLASTGASTISGNITSGDVTLNDSGTTTISGNIELGTSGNLYSTGTGNDVITGTIEGSGSAVWRETQNGDLTLSHSNTYTGATNISDGSVVVTTNGAMGPASAAGVFVTSGGALAFSGGVSYTTLEEPIDIAGSGPAGNGAIESISGSNSLASAITLTGNATVGADAGTLTLNGNIDLGSAGNLTATGAGNTTVTGVISGEATGVTSGLIGAYFNIGANQNLIQPANTSNTNWLGNQTPAAIATLVGPLDFPDISDNGFADNVGNAAYFNLGGGNNNNVEGRWYGDILIPGTGTTPVPINFATISDDGSTLYVDGVLVVNNNFFQGATRRTGLVDLTPGLHAIDIEYYNGGGGASMDAQWDPTGGTNFVDIPNSAFVTGGNNVVKVGSGTLTLSNSNTYVGATSINAGTLVATVNGAMGPATDPGITVNAGGALAFAGGVNYSNAEPTTIAGSGPAGNGAIENISGTNTFAAPIATLMANATIGSDAGTLNLTAATLDLGASNLTTTGAGNIVFSTAITSTPPPTAYVGFTAATGGANSTQNLLDWTYTSGATDIDYSGGFATNTLNLNGGAVVNGTAIELTDGNNNEARTAWTPSPVPIGSFTTTFQWTYGVNPQADGFTFAVQDSSNTVVGGGGGSLGYNGIPGESAAAQFNLYNGVSTFGLGLNGAINHPIDLTAFGIDFHANSSDTFQATLTSDGNGNLTVSIWDTTLNPTTNPANYTQTFADPITNFASTLTKNGTGTVTLAAANTYTGATTVNAGVLDVTGSTGNVTVNGGVLAGTGTVGAITDNDGTNPGSPPSSTGTLSASSANFSSGGNLTVNITGTSPTVTNDLLNVSGAVTLGGTSTLTVDLNGLTSTGTYTVVTDGSQTGQFSAFNVVNNPNGYQVTVGYASDTVTITVGTATSTPISIVSRTVNGDLLNVTSSISSAVEAAGSTTVQITTSSADGLYVGEQVKITGVGTAAFNGTYTVASVIDSTDFTYIDTNFNSSSPGSISNGGSAVNALGGAQRSMVDAITYKFNQAVTLGSGAISMDVNSGYTGTAGVVPTISYATIDDGHTWIVTFSGSSVTGNSIADGVYDITLNASAVTADVGTGTLASSQTDTFFRLFGDSNGDASVTSRPDVQNFAASFGTSNTSSTYLAYFDYNADGSITSRPDVQNFATRFGTSLTGFTPTI